MELLDKELNRLLTKQELDIFNQGLNKNITYYNVDRVALENEIYKVLISTDITTIDRKVNYLLSIVRNTIESKNLARHFYSKDVVVKKEEYENELTIDLTKKLNENSFNGSLETYARILLTETHTYRQFNVSIDDLKTTNIKIINYLKTKNILTYEIFEKCLFKSKIMENVAIPTAYIQEQANVLVDWDKTIRKIITYRPIENNGLNII